MREQIFDAACVNIACGLDPQRCILFVQTSKFQVRCRGCSIDAGGDYGNRAHLAQAQLSDDPRELASL
jgi:hypothetical protein